MKRFYSSLLALAVLSLSLSSVTAFDPCGMVPPIYTGNVVPIKRIGLQQTYVFYKDGVESVVIRPGFSGNVDNFQQRLFLYQSQGINDWNSLGLKSFESSSQTLKIVV